MILVLLVALSSFLTIDASKSKNERFKDVDWRGDYMTPVGDQASCGGCVGFALAGALEWYTANVTGYVIPLSVQYLVDCGINAYSGKAEDGCSGGAINSKIRQLMEEQYIPYDEDYKYVANYKEARCKEVGAKDKLLKNALADVWLYGYIPLSQNPDAIREALQTGPTIHGMSIGESILEWQESKIVNNDVYTSFTEIFTDDGDGGCMMHPNAHAMSFVGWQHNNKDPYYIVRASYGKDFGVDGYLKYADNLANEACSYVSNSYRLKVGRRRELEYRLGEGKLTFVGARKWCQEQGDGWDLAHVPTEMHTHEVYDMFTATYGRDKKNDNDFNFIWIGLYNTRKSEAGEGFSDQKWVWVSGDPELDANNITGTDIQNFKFAPNYLKNRYGAMLKVNKGSPRQRGAWADQPGWKTFRFVCSRYREEYCPRISHTSIRNAHKVTFISHEDGAETLEIVKGTRAKVSCMDGYTTFGKDGECGERVWNKLPICSSKSSANITSISCKVLESKSIKKAVSITMNGVISNGFADEGSSIDVSCKKKYVMVAQGKCVCKEGKWEKLPKCVKLLKKRKRGKKENEAKIEIIEYLTCFLWVK